MDNIHITMVTDRVTKNTIRYSEVEEPGQPPKIKTLYIQKWALGVDPPRTITVTVSD